MISSQNLINIFFTFQFAFPCENTLIFRVKFPVETYQCKASPYGLQWGHRKYDICAFGLHTFVKYPGSVRHYARVMLTTQENSIRSLSVSEPRESDVVNHVKVHPTTDNLLRADLGVLVHGHLQHRLGSLSGGIHTCWDHKVCDPSKIGLLLGQHLSKFMHFPRNIRVT